MNHSSRCQCWECQEKRPKAELLVEVIETERSIRRAINIEFTGGAWRVNWEVTSKRDGSYLDIGQWTVRSWNKLVEGKEE